MKFPKLEILLMKDQPLRRLRVWMILNVIIVRLNFPRTRMVQIHNIKNIYMVV
ncbi:hypothetical protein Gotri_018749 [Gossypium trilobum]|uniref:Uncharacterized protein n=1 Tax=Gossypium trilobum TaxID=34281 RepID=A0A7J9EAM9_9ROSI|nr:hypothetical protein [Gossypium trilobum]